MITQTQLEKEEFETRFIFKLTLIGEDYTLPISNLNFYANPYGSYEKSWEKISAMNKIISILRNYFKSNSMDLIEKQLVDPEVKLLNTRNAVFNIQLIDLQGGGENAQKIVYDQNIDASEFAVQSTLNIIPIWKDKTGIRSVLKTFLSLRQYSSISKPNPNTCNMYSSFNQDLQKY